MFILNQERCQGPHTHLESQEPCNLGICAHKQEQIHWPYSTYITSTCSYNVLSTSRKISNLKCSINASHACQGRYWITSLARAKRSGFLPSTSLLIHANEFG